MEPQECSSPPRVLIFPFPVQGHINSMMNLAKILHMEGVEVTFLNSIHNHRRLARNTDVETPRGFRFRAISDGLPEDHPRSGGQIMELFDSLERRTKVLFKDMVAQMKPPPDCIIGDGNMGFVVDVADELGVPVIHFRTISACCFWVYFSLPQLIQAGELPVDDDDMDKLVTKVPGMENFLRCRDLPSFCRVSDTNDCDLSYILNVTQRSSNVKGLILNTFEELEHEALEHIRKHCHTTYTIGPLHHHLKARLKANPQEAPHHSNSLWEDDTSCITWLDAQPAHSVLYVSFGSIATMTQHELKEIWHGIIDSKQRFLWVVRPDSIVESNDHEVLSPDILKGVEERGYIASWVPQEKVLEHRAVGGFFTHSGWNSSLEGMVAGVPMVCWPYFADQQVNSRFVSEVWKVGLDMKDVCDRGVVTRMVNELMVQRRGPLQESVSRIAQLANKSVSSEGGTSLLNLNHLIDDIKTLKMMS